jgi:hypothetical protein
VNWTGVPGRFAKAFVPSGMGFDSSSFRMLVPDAFARKFGMSPYAMKEFDIAISLEDVIEAQEDKTQVLTRLEQDYSMTTAELVDIVIKDKHTIEIFKEAWHNPEYKMDIFDELVFEKLMENELGRS